MHQTSSNIRYLAIAALFAALVTLSIVVFRIPVGPGILHFGDAVIYLAACLLPKPFALAAASIGGGMANIVTGTAIWAPATIVIKPLIAAWFTSEGKCVCARNVAALFIAGIVTIVGYYVYDALVVTGNWVAPLARVWGNVVQSTGSAVIFLLIAGAFDRMNIKASLGLGTK